MLTIDLPSSLVDQSPLNKSALTRFLNRARAVIELQGNVDVLLTSDVEIKRLNRLFRGKNKATDVLSFPASVEAEEVAGDLAISLETAARQAAEHGHSLQDELRILLIHGLLHLHGEDHEADSGEMAARELALRAQLGLRSGLIERAQSRSGASRKAAGKPA